MEWGKNKKVMYVLMYEAQYGQLLFSVPWGVSRINSWNSSHCSQLSLSDSMAVSVWILRRTAAGDDGLNRARPDVVIRRGIDGELVTEKG